MLEFANKKVTQNKDNVTPYIFSELYNSEEMILGINNPYPDVRRSKHVTKVENVISSVT